MTDRTSPTARPGATTPRPDPLQMTAAEKCMAEWEARHDVAARGRRGDPEALQHYVARSRVGTPARPQAAVRATHDEQARPAAALPEQAGPRRGSLLARLLRRSG